MESGRAPPRVAASCRMKALIAVALVCALVAGALFWPVAGRSFWQRADDRGLPRAAARLAARGLRSTWDLVFHRPAATAPPPRPGPARRVARKAEPARDPAPAKDPDRIPERTASLAAGPDRIVAQPPRETLRPGDRAGLEKLLRAR